MPNHTTNSGSTASNGIVFRICATPLNTYSPVRRKPPSTPVRMPAVNPIARPIPARCNEIARSGPRTPSFHSSTVVLRISVGAGAYVGLRIPAWARTSHTMRIATGVV
jgi:hypothetical protein